MGNQMETPFHYTITECGPTTFPYDEETPYAAKYSYFYKSLPEFSELLDYLKANPNDDDEYFFPIRDRTMLHKRQIVRKHLRDTWRESLCRTGCEFCSPYYEEFGYVVEPNMSSDGLSATIGNNCEFCSAGNIDFDERVQVLPPVPDDVIEYAIKDGMFYDVILDL